jgi:hypothetical protein
MPKGGKGVAKKAVPVAPMQKKAMPTPTPKKPVVPVGTSLNTPKAGTGGIGTPGPKQTAAQKEALEKALIQKMVAKGNLGTRPGPAIVKDNAKPIPPMAPRAVARKPVAMTAPAKKTVRGR